jgi:hypothetical protein
MKEPVVSGENHRPQVPDILFHFSLASTSTPSGELHYFRMTRLSGE